MTQTGIENQTALRAAVNTAVKANVAIYTLDARGLDLLHPAMKAHGVPWLRAGLAGNLTLAAAAIEAKKDTRRYAKRQFTWFRHQLPGFRWIADDRAKQHVLQALDAVRA